MRRLDLDRHAPYLDVRFDPRLPKADQFTLLEDTEVWFGSRLLCRIPAGFLSDGASVPALLWSVAPALDNRVLIAYVVHDFLYCEWEAFLVQHPASTYDNPRLWADALMLEMMDSLAPERWLRNYLYYIGVRAGGWWNWRQFRKKVAYSSHEMVWI